MRFYNITTIFSAPLEEIVQLIFLTKSLPVIEPTEGVFYYPRSGTAYRTMPAPCLVAGISEDAVEGSGMYCCPLESSALNPGH